MNPKFDQCEIVCTFSFRILLFRDYEVVSVTFHRFTDIIYVCVLMLSFPSSSFRFSFKNNKTLGLEKIKYPKNINLFG